MDAADQALVGSAAAGLPSGQLSPVNPAGPDSQAGWDGYLYAAETGLYEVRFRAYSPELGRWMERDPAGYVDGAGLYQYACSSPGSGIDPSGLDRHVFAFEGLSGHPKMDPIKLSDAFLEIYWKRIAERLGAVWHYYTEADRGVFSAVAEAMRIARIPDPSAPAGSCYHTIVVLGYSNGGRAAIQFAEALRDHGIAVDLGFTADPIPKGLENLPPLTLFPGVFLTKPANVREWQNYYQRTDWLLKGNPVINADHQEQFDLGIHGHLEIVGDQRVRDQLEYALGCTNEWRVDWRWP